MPFDVHAEHARLRIGRHQVDVVRSLQHQHVADRCGLVHLDAVRDRLHREVDGVGAALRDEAYVAGLADMLIGKVAQPEGGTVKAHAVGADQRDVGVERGLAQLALELDSQFLGGFGKSRGEESDRADLVVDAILQDARRDLARHRADRIVDVLGDFGEALAILDAHRLDGGNLVGIDLHRVELAGEALERAQPHVAAHLLVADDDRDLGLERALEILEALGAARIGIAAARALGPMRMRASSVDDPVRIRDDRIEIHLLDLGSRGGEFGKLRNRVGDRIDIDRRAAAHSMQHRRAAQAQQHRARFLRIDRRETQRGVLHQLDEDSAETDHDQRTEALIAHDAGDQLEAGLRHRLHRDALEPRARLLLARAHRGCDRKPRALPSTERRLSSTPPTSLL